MNRPRLAALLLLVPAAVLSSVPSRALGAGELREPAGQEAPQEPRAGAEAGLEEALAAAGLRLDRDANLLALPARVQIKNDLLEYLLVGPGGATHESLFLTAVRPSLLNAALLLLGVEPGHNAYVVGGGEVDERGHTTRRIYPPEGDGFYLYAAWREAGETYFFRVEDLVRNLESGRSLRRHRWVYLGSRFQALSPGKPESFVADLAGNLINLSFFYQGNTLLTAAPEECAAQTIWAANEWLLPEMGEPVWLVFARAPLATLPAGWEQDLPAVAGSDASGKAEEQESEADR